MIFVTVGTSPQGFARLVEAMDAWSAEQAEPVVIQFGHTQCKLRSATGFTFVPSVDQLLDYVRASRIVVSHAGVGSILNARRLGKPVVIFPRLPELGEAADDHQVATADRLADGRTVLVAKDAAGLASAIAQARDGDMAVEPSIVPYLRAELAKLLGARQ